MLVRREDDTKDVTIELTNIGGLGVEISSVKIESDWLEPFSFRRLGSPSGFTEEQTTPLLLTMFI